MRVVERTGDATGQPDRLLNRELLLPLEAPPQRFAFHVRHHIVDQAAYLAGIEQRQDVRVLQVGGDSDLTQEALDPEHRGDLGTQHLQGDGAIVLQIPGEIHGRHATGADLTLDSIALGEGRPETFQRIGHASPRYRPAKTAATVARRSCAARPSGKLVGNPGCRDIVVYTYDYSDNLLTQDCAMTASPLIAPRFPRAAAVVVTVWLGLALLAGATGFLARLPFPGPQLIFLALVVATLVAATGVPALRAWVEALPLRTLIGINALRFIGITFLVLAARGQMSHV